MAGKFKLLAYFFGIVPMAAGLGMASAAEVYQPVAAVTLPNGQTLGSFDISFVDPALREDFVADRTNKSVDVIDTSKDTFSRQLLAGFVGNTGNSDTSGPNGVLVVNHRFVWAGDGNSTVKVIDLTDGSLVATIPTGGTSRADELCYDQADNMILMANDADSPPFVTFIDASSFKVLGQIAMSGANGTPKATNGIEQCQWSPRTGMFYLNLPEVNGPGDDSQPGAVVVISPKTQSIVTTFTIPVAQCAGPQGMALGPENQILLGCNAPGPSGNNPTVIINERSGTVLATLDNESGSDEVWFNPGNNTYFLAESGNPAGPALGVVTAAPKQDQPSAATGSSSAHSVAADEVSNEAFVPIPPTTTGTVCSSVGGFDAEGCIAIYANTSQTAHK